MTDAPDKIWAEETIGGQYSVGQKSGRWYSSEFNGDREIEYTRTDIIPAMLAEARAKGIREAAAFCRNNEVGITPSQGYVCHPRHELSGGTHPGEEYARAILALLDQHAMRCAECDCEHGGEDCNWIVTKPAETEGVTVQEAARVVLRHLLNLTDSDVWEAAQDAFDEPTSDGPEVVIVALCALSGDRHE